MIGATVRCGRCSHPVEDDRGPFSQANRVVCEECADDEKTPSVAVLPRSEGGKSL